MRLPRTAVDEDTDMHPVLRLYEDVLSSAETVEFQLAPLPRFIFVVHGSATIDGKSRERRRGLAGRRRGDGEARPGGVTCWRWELARGDRAQRSPARPA